MKLRLALCLLTSLMALTACASARDQTAAAARFGTDETRDAVVDAVGLPRERPQPVMVDAGDETVPTPYGGHGEPRRCSSVATDIARLTAVLGPDAEFAYILETYEVPADVNNDGDEEWIDQSRVWAERSGDAATDGARSLYRSVIVGLNPARPVIRFVGRAGEIEREARERREMAQKRRAYLRGLFDGFGCSNNYLERAYSEYGLIN